MAKACRLEALLKCATCHISVFDQFVNRFKGSTISNSWADRHRDRNYLAIELDEPFRSGERIMKSYTLSKISLSGLAFFFAMSSQASGLRCKLLFIEARQSLTEYKAVGRERSRSVAPKYSNPQHEMMASKTWDGIKGPEIVQAMLPEGVTLIDHALIGANEEGVVKTNSGSLVHVRAKIGDVGTNMGVNIAALKDNLHREQKSFVRESADAVIVFIHGGGTKTTGHHVAASMMSWMNVRNYDVVSLDMPWHGEGARVSFDSVKDSLEHMRDYVKKYIAPSGKPIILVGHSMGGVVSDMYMRMFPNDKLFAGVVPLSTVADALPGATAEQKLIQDGIIAERNKTNPNIPESERDLGEWLARQNKLSPTCGMFCQTLIMGINWDAPAHKGDQYLPALYVIGRGDGLYQGYEKSFAGVAELANAEVKIIDDRRDLKDKDGKLVSIGHLIFDNRPRIDFAADIPQAAKQSILAGTIKEADFNKLRAEGKITLDAAYKFEDIMEPETFVLVKNFISKLIGKPVQRVKADSSPLELVTQAYANNLAFREFAKTYVFQHMRATEKAAVLGEEMARMQQKLRHFAQIRKQNNGKLTEQESADQDSVTARIAELGLILGQKGVVSAANSARYKELQDKQNAINTTTQQLAAERKQLRTNLEEKKQTVNRSEKAIAEFEKSLVSPELAQLRKAKEEAFIIMMKQDEKVRELTNGYLSASHSNGQFKKGLFENIPQDTVREFEKYEHVADLYQKLLRKYEGQLMQEALKGHLKFTEQQAAITIGKETVILSKEDVEKRVHEAALTASQSSEGMQGILVRLEALEKDLTAYANQSFLIEKELAQLVGSDYFAAEYYTLEQLLSQNVEAARTNKDGMSGLLQRLWADWQKIWSVRIAESSESLY